MRTSILIDGVRVVLDSVTAPGAHSPIYRVTALGRRLGQVQRLDHDHERGTSYRWGDVEGSRVDVLRSMLGLSVEVVEVVESVRVRSPSGSVAHVLGDDGETLCGRDPSGMVTAEASVRLCKVCGRS